MYIEKQNAIIIGRKTWDSLPANRRPLPGRFNVVLSGQPKEAFPGAHLVCTALADAVETISSPPLTEKIESIFILGGAAVYEVCDAQTHTTHIHGHTHTYTPLIKYAYAICDRIWENMHSSHIRF